MSTALYLTLTITCYLLSIAAAFTIGRVLHYIEIAKRNRVRPHLSDAFDQYNYRRPPMEFFKITMDREIDKAAIEAFKKAFDDVGRKGGTTIIPDVPASELAGNEPPHINERLKANIAIVFFAMFLAAVFVFIKNLLNL